MPATKCGGCAKFLSPIEGVTCSLCDGVYHRACVGLPKGYTSPSWRCPECSKNERRDNKTETPVRGRLDATPGLICETVCSPSKLDSEPCNVGLNDDLSSIATWSTQNNLMLNPNKTKYLLLGSTRRLSTLCPSARVVMLGQQIECVSEARNLGLHMDSSLRFEKHVATCIKSCFYKLKILYKIRPYIQESLRSQLVESLVLSKLNYMDTVFGPRLLVRTQKIIQRVQNACARFCFDIPLRAHVTPFLNKNIILKMKHRRKLHFVCLLFGVLNH